MGLSLDDSHHTLDGVIDFLIIGGGVAGLSAANRLCDLGLSPVVVEAGDYPAHKVCGEFLSPEVLPILADWSIVPPCTIRNVHFFAGKEEFCFQLPEPAGSLSRYELDTLLVKRAEANGARFLCNTKVDSLIYPEGKIGQHYIAHLSTGRTCRARNIFVGSGRVTSQNDSKVTFKPQFFGFKAHFSGIELQESLQMHALPGAYLGISNVERGIANVACLADVSSISKTLSPQECVKKVFNLPGATQILEILSRGTMVNDDWMTVFAPAFGKRTMPNWEHAYFVGEAAGTIPPATGDGLGMAITSGVMAANFAVKRDWQGFRDNWNKRYTTRMIVGKFLHRIVTKPAVASWMISASKLFPTIPHTVFYMTRER